MSEDRDLREELAVAQATIAQQAMHIHRLEREAERRSGLDALRDVVQLANIAAVMVGEAPYRALLAGIVEAAQRLFGASAASIALLDRDGGELVFEAATGAGSEDILSMRFPAHQGIAGWVVMTGEPLAVSDVRRDPRFARDFAQSTGYVPQSILAVPLIVRDDVEGVLEVLDKRDATSFGLDDMELLGLFARPAALAVEQARMVTGMGGLLVAELGRLAGERDETALRRAAEALTADHGAAGNDTLELARLVHDLEQRGDRARQLALDILGSIGRFAR